MSYLFDVNILIAWAWDDHPHHTRARKWIASVMKSKGSTAFTCPIVELGFIRVSMQKSFRRVETDEAVEELKNLLDVLKQHHKFLPDDLSSTRIFPAWCKNPKHTTDAHLLALAEKHGLQLATLDTGIPGAFVIPE